MTKDDGTVLRRDKITALNPHGTDVVTVQGSMTQVSAGLDGEVWSIGTDGSVYHRADVADYTPQGSGWSLMSGAQFIQVSVGDCQVMGINENHEFFRRTNVSPDNKEGDGWQQVTGQFIYISVGYGPVVWVIDELDRVYFKQWGPVDHEGEHPSSPPWQPVDATKKMIQLDVGRDGNVWGVATDKKVYRRTGITSDPPVHAGTGWAEVTDDQDGDILKVDMCTTGNVWCLRQSG
jgi:hypothetical protein